VNQVIGANKAVNYFSATYHSCPIQFYKSIVVTEMRLRAVCGPQI